MQTTMTFASLIIGAALYFTQPITQEPVSAPAPVVCDCNCDVDIAELRQLNEQFTSELANLEQCHASDVEALRSEITAIRTVATSKPATIVPAPVIVQQAAAPQKASDVVSQPVRLSDPQSTSPSSYSPRWQNYDGKDRMQHASQDHGIDVSRYSQSQVLQMMDADHDRFGGQGHSAIQASRNVVQSAPVYRQQVQSNCPGGVCPTAQPVRQTVRRGLGIFRR